MKRLILIFLASTALIVGFIAYAQHPWLGKTMSAQQVGKKWGKKEFNEELFKTGDMKLRSEMAFSLINTKKMLGLTPVEIRTRLGDFDGHYFSESYPTYLIQEAKSPGEESWQIVFLIDRAQKTKSVIVHKNCCE